MRASLVFIGLLAACVPEAPDTSEPDGLAEPLGFTVTGAFGYDPELDEAVPYSLQAGEVPLLPWVDVQFEILDRDGEPNDCGFTMHTIGDQPMPRADWASESGMGFEVTDTAQAAGNCRHWDAQLWGDNPALTLAERFSWGVGVGDLVEGVVDAVAADIEPDQWELHWEPYILGGAVAMSGFEGDVSNQAYAFGYQVDDDFVMLYEDAPDPAPGPAFHNLIADALPITRPDEPDAPLPRGVYVVLSAGPFDAALLAE